MNVTEPIPSDWHWGTPEGSREFDRLIDRRLTFREKLEWREETETLALQMRVRPKPIQSGGADGSV
jgi:hypothetical protein